MHNHANSAVAFIAQLYTISSGTISSHKMMIDKFVVINDSAYDSVREMKAWLEGEGRQ
jgi:hypothetical protein